MHHFHLPGYLVRTGAVQFGQAIHDIRGTWSASNHDPTALLRTQLTKRAQLTLRRVAPEDRVRLTAARPDTRTTVVTPTVSCAEELPRGWYKSPNMSRDGSTWYTKTCGQKIRVTSSNSQNSPLPDPLRSFAHPWSVHVPSSPSDRDLGLTSSV